MLDEENGNLERITNFTDIFHQLCRFRGVHTGGRLVQQQQRGVGGQRPDNLQTALCTVRQGTGLDVCDVLHVEQAQKLQRPLVGNLFFFPEAGEAENAADHAVLHLGIHGGGDIFLYGQVVKQANILEGTGDTRPIHLRGGHIVGIPAIQQNCAVSGLVNLGQQIENRGLTSTVGADETGNLRAADHEVEIVHGLQAAEGNAQIHAVEDGPLINVPLRNHGAGGNRNQLSKHIRRPPFRFSCRASAGGRNSSAWDCW